MKTLLDRPVTVSVLALSLLLLGGLSLDRLPLDLMPEMESPVMRLETHWEGADPEQMEREVTRPLEGMLSTLPGLQHIRSWSSAGRSVIVVGFGWKTDLDASFLAAREKIETVRPTLPEGVSRPVLMRNRADGRPIAVVAVSIPDHGGQSGEIPPEQAIERRRVLDWVEEDLARRFEQLDWIGYVQVVLPSKPSLRIEVNPVDLHALGAEMDLVEARIRSSMQKRSAGVLMDGGLQLPVVIDAAVGSLGQLASLPLKRMPDGTVFRLEDVAALRWDSEEMSDLIELDGQSVALLLIHKTQKANILEAYDALIAEMQQVRSEYPDTLLHLVRESVTQVRESVLGMLQALLLSGILAFAVLYPLLRDFWLALSIGVVIPSSLCLVFILMLVLDLPLNLISISGITLGIGLLVDTAIVILENITRRVEEARLGCESGQLRGEERSGESSPVGDVAFLKASTPGRGWRAKESIRLSDIVHRATREVAMAVTASTLTTLSVFLPLTLGQGVQSVLFRQQAITLGMSLFASLLVSLFLLPAFIRFVMLRRRVPTPRVLDSRSHTGAIKALIPAPLWHHTSGSDDGEAASAFTRLTRAYAILSRRVNQRPVSVLLAAGITSIVALSALPGLPRDMVPAQEPRQFDVRLHLPSDASQELLHEVAIGIRAHIDSLVPPPNRGILLQTYSSDRQAVSAALNREGAQSERLNAEGSGIRLHIPVDGMREWAAWREAVSDLGRSISGLRVEESSSGDGFEAFRLQGMDGIIVRVGGSGGIDEVDGGLDTASVAVFAEQANAWMRSMDISFKLNPLHANELQMLRVVRNRNVRDAGLAASNATGVIQDLLAGRHLGSFHLDGVEVPVRLTRSGFGRLDPGSIRVWSGGGGSTLDEQIRLDPARNHGVIERDHQRRVQTLVLQALTPATPSDPESPLIPRLDRATYEQLKADLDPIAQRHGLTLQWAGRMEETRELLAGLAGGIGVSLLLIVLILSIQFESLILPWVILAAAPFAWMGSIMAIVVSGTGLNMFSLVGTLLLTGISVNDAILKVDFMRRYLAHSGDLEQAVHMAALHRFRPVMMTSLTTILGALVMMLPLGGGAETRQALAITLVGGMVSATLMTLFVTPVLFMLTIRMQRATTRFRARVTALVSSGRGTPGHRSAKRSHPATRPATFLVSLLVLGQVILGCGPNGMASGPHPIAQIDIPADAHARAADSAPPAAGIAPAPESLKGTISSTSVSTYRPEIGFIVATDDPVEERLLVYGEVISRLRQQLVAPMGGLVVQSAIRSGLFHHRGDTLYRLDPKEAEFRLRRAQVGFDKAVVRYQMDFSVYEFDAGVSNDGSSTTSDAQKEWVRQAEIASGLAEAGIELDEAVHAVQKTWLLAPFDGITLSPTPLTPGTRIEQGQRLGELVHPGELEVEVRILERDVGQVRVGRPAIIQTVDGGEHLARIDRILPVIDPDSRTFTAYLALTSPTKALLPGQRVSATISIRNVEGIVNLPERAVLKREERHVIFRLREGRVHWEYIDPPERIQGRALLHHSTIQSGDTIAVHGHFTLTHMQSVRVRLLEDPP